MDLKPVDANFTLKDHVYDVLRAAILDMDIYNPETDLRLDERQMADQLGISRTPVREALARLAQDGLVGILPRRGVFVRRKSMTEILDMVIVWAALESMAARLACERAATEDIARLRTVAGAFTQDGARARISEYSEANIAFHLHVLGLSGCQMLQDHAESLFVHLKPVRRRAMRDSTRADRSVVDHTNIIESIEARDAELAATLVRTHTMRLHDYLAKTWVDTETAAVSTV